MLNRADVIIPSDVAYASRDEYVENYLAATRSTGRLMMFAGDQKIEHLNKDFRGPGISSDDSDPEHLFRIASKGTIGCLATQPGLIARYGAKYPGVPYIAKMNSHTNLLRQGIADPLSTQLVDLQDVLRLRENGMRILGVGYTLYIGSVNESVMMREAAKLIADAHREGFLAILWLYPRGKAVPDPSDPKLTAGGCGVAVCLGADFVKISPPYGSPESLHAASLAAGNTGVVCAGGSCRDPSSFLGELYNQIHVGGACGNATGRNIHQREFEEASRLCNAISSVTLADYSPEDAMKVFEGEMEFSI